VLVLAMFSDQQWSCLLPGASSGFWFDNASSGLLIVKHVLAFLPLFKTVPFVVFFIIDCRYFPQRNMIN
jgi:hypothetical protein